MNDRFKFRIWDKRKNNYIKDFVFNFISKSPYITVEYFDNEYEYTHTFDEDEIIIEQCTGLKDKNGKLIYENDIIRIDGYDAAVMVDDYGCWCICPKGNPIKGCIEWNDVVKECFYVHDNISPEVIGNIHENKELLDD